MVVFSRTSVLLVILTVLCSPYLQSVVGEEEIFIQQLANFSADPCEDFYEYACGKFTTVFPNPSPPKTWTMNDVVYQKGREKLKQALKNISTKSRAISIAQKYFRQCLDFRWQDQLPLIKIIDEFGNWPIYNSKWKTQQKFEKIWNINEFLIKAMKYQTFPFVKLVLSQSSFADVLIEKPEFEKTDNYRSFYKAVTETLARIDHAYKKASSGENKHKSRSVVRNRVKVLEKFNQKAFPTRIDPTHFLSKKMKKEEEAIIQEMFFLGQDLAKLNKSKAGEEDVSYVVNFQDICEGPHDGVDLCKMLQSYFDNILPSNATVYYEHHEYLGNFEKVIMKYSKRTVASYIVWKVIHSLTTQLANTPYRTVEQIEKQKEPNKKEKEDLCVVETVEKFPLSITRLFVDEVLDGSAETTTKRIAAIIMLEAQKQKFEFFDDETWKKANLKLKKTRFLLLYPDFIFNDTALDNYYQSYNSSEDYLSMIIQHALFQRDIQRWALSQKPIDPQYLFELPLFPAGTTHVKMNWIRITLSFALQPLFYFHAPLEVLYSSLGRVLGHEILHLILTIGSIFDHNQSENRWWSNTSVANFKDNEKCFKDFYSKMTMFGLPIKGGLVIGEVSADAGGLFLAYKALERTLGEKELTKITSFANLKLTKAQTFFLSFAQLMCSEYHVETSMHVFDDSHPFESIRLKGTLQNSKEFAKAFNCPSGSTYNPEPKCQLYGN